MFNGAMKNYFNCFYTDRQIIAITAIPTTDFRPWISDFRFRSSELYFRQSTSNFPTFVFGHLISDLGFQAFDFGVLLPTIAV